MKKINWQSIVIAILVLMVMARSRQIAGFLDNFHPGNVLTLAPLENCSENMRFLVTLGFFSLLFVAVYFSLNKRK